MKHAVQILECLFNLCMTGFFLWTVSTLGDIRKEVNKLNETVAFLVQEDVRQQSDIETLKARAAVEDFDWSTFDPTKPAIIYPTSNETGRIWQILNMPDPTKLTHRNSPARIPRR